MRYNLLKKEVANTWEGAKEKHIKSISLDENRINGKYGKAFPYDYDPEVHFVYEGELKPFKILNDFSLYFYTEDECALLGYRELINGESIMDGNLVFEKCPIDGYRWNGVEWIEERLFGIYTGYITLESEKDMARLERDIQFKALDLYDKAVLRDDVVESIEMRNERDEFRTAWLILPEIYTDISTSIEEIYPDMPDAINYFK